MRILVATGLYPPDIGGPATHTVFLEQHAPRLGLEIVVVSFGRVRRYPPIIRHILYFLLLLWHGKRTNIIYALDTVSVGVPAALASFCLRQPLLLRVPGDYAWEQGQQRFGITETLDEFRQRNSRPFPVRILSWLQSQVARHATHVIVPSEYMKKVVSEWGIPLERITRIYSVLKTLHGKKEHGVKRDSFVVTTAARLVPWKGIHCLISVVASLRKHGMPIRLNVIGDGVCRDELEAHSYACNLGEHISFHGAIPREALGDILASSDVFVLNTSYEGLSHQLIEAMSLGLPIITTPVGGNVELITHEETGLLVPYNDEGALAAALQRLQGDRTLACSLGERARGSLERFSEERILSEIGCVFTSVWK